MTQLSKIYSTQKIVSFQDFVWQKLKTIFRGAKQSARIEPKIQLHDDTFLVL